MRTARLAGVGTLALVATTAGCASPGPARRSLPDAVVAVCQGAINAGRLAPSSTAVGLPRDAVAVARRWGGAGFADDVEHWLEAGAPASSASARVVVGDCERLGGFPTS